MNRRSSQPPRQHETSEALQDAVAKLTEHVKIVWQTLDEIREDLQWALRNAENVPGLGRPIRVTSMALDPCDPEWGEKLNALRPEDLPSEEQQRPRDASVIVDAAQFERAMDRLASANTDGKRADRITMKAEQFAAAMENVDELVYCCSEAQLAWEGDPDAPSVVCKKCGYVVAEYGNVVDVRSDWKNGTNEGEPLPGEARRPSQGLLFAEEEESLGTSDRKKVAVSPRNFLCLSHP